MSAIRKRPLGKLTRTYLFRGEEPWDYARPLRAMAQWVKRHEDLGPIVLAVGVNLSEEDASVTVAMTVELTK